MRWDRTSQCTTRDRPRRSAPSRKRHGHGQHSGGASRSTGRAVARARCWGASAAVLFLVAAALCISATPLTSTAAAASKGTQQLAIKAVRASSHLAGHGVTLAIDGRRGSRWIAASRKYPQWIRVDLGTLHSVDQLKIAWYRAATRTYCYRVQTSRNGKSWQTFASGVWARYVRLRIDRCSVTSSPGSVCELTVLGASGSAQQDAPAPTPGSNPSQPPSPAKPQTINHLVISSGTHDKVYNNVTFTGGGDGNPSSSGVIEVTGSVYNITFVNCTIEPNADGVGDGVKIVDSGGTVHDITFSNCHFMSQPRMGFECINRPGGKNAGYQQIDLIGCTFEPQGSEAISFDDDSAGAAGNCLLQANVIKGAGINPAYPWGQALEINEPSNMIVAGNTFHAGRGDIWNLRMQTTSDCGWVFSDNVLDASVSMQTVPMDPEANCIIMNGVYGGVFSGNAIASAAPGGGVAWMDDCHGMDWRTTTWHDVRGQLYSTPMQVDCTDDLF